MSLMANNDVRLVLMQGLKLLFFEVSPDYKCKSKRGR